MWLEFRSKMEPFNVFSIRDINKMIPGMNNMNLVRWQQKGYLIKIIKGWYCFTESRSDENISWLAANRIYYPSYISLHTALSYYNLIPEAIYITTSVSTRKTKQFDTVIGNYSYNTIKKSAFGYGHKLINEGSDRNTRKILIAELEKAVLDFFYINHQYKTEKDMEDLRLDQLVLNTMDKTKFYNYLDRFENKALNERIFKMLKVYA